MPIAREEARSGRMTWSGGLHTRVEEEQRNAMVGRTEGGGEGERSQHHDPTIDHQPHREGN